MKVSFLALLFNWQMKWRGQGLYRAMFLKYHLITSVIVSWMKNCVKYINYLKKHREFHYTSLIPHQTLKLGRKLQQISNKIKQSHQRKFQSLSPAQEIKCLDKQREGSRWLVSGFLLVVITEGSIDQGRKKWKERGHARVSEGR